MKIPTPDELQKAKKPESHTSLADMPEVRHESTKDVLPIDAKRVEIVHAVNNHQAVVLGAETGAGKSTRVSRMLMDEGYDVIITEPRRMPARTVSERVATELEQDGLPADLVGYRTGRDRNDTSVARMLYCTDGLQLIRELHEKRIPGQKRVLVIDEVHEWNINIELLVAWSKKQMQEDPDFKVVCMSATIAGKPLQEYFGANAALIEVQGRTYPVEKHIGTGVVPDTVRLAREGKNVLVFLPGVGEIKAKAQELLQYNLAAEIVCLDGSMDTAEQKKALISYPNGKIVLTTNVAQNGITIPDIDAVVDCGLERRTEVRNGIEGLFLADISQADCLQRAGRAGRVKAGEYYLSPLDNATIAPLEARQEYSTPEILRSRLDSVIMKLAGAGFDIEEFDFYHQPPKQEVAIAKERLIKLGALSPDGVLTTVGKQMERLPVDSHYARMLVEIQKHNNPQLTFMMMELIAIQQAGGIVKNGKYNTEWQRLTTQNQSDLLAELEVLHALNGVPKAQWKDHDILGKNVREARQVLRELRRALRIDYEQSGLPQGDQIEDIQKAIVAGLIDQVWQRDSSYGSCYTSIFGDESRELSYSSVVADARLIVGRPFDLQIQANYGLKTLHLLQDITAIRPEWLAEIAPQLLSAGERSQTSFDPTTGRVRVEGDLKFGSLTVGSQELTPSDEQKVSAYIRCLLHSEHMYSRWYAHLAGELDALWSEINLHDADYAQEINGRFKAVLKAKLRQSMPTSLYGCLAQPPHISIDEIFTGEDVARIMLISEQNPAEITIAGTIVPVRYSRDIYSRKRAAEIEVQLSLAAQLIDAPDPSNIPDGLSIDLSDAGKYVNSFASLAELRAYVTEYIAAKSEYAIARAEQNEKQKLDEAAIAQGNPEHFGGKTRLNTGSNNVGYWVIQPDGLLRQPDSDGTWRVLRDGEVAIRLEHPSRDAMVGEHRVVWQSEPASEQQIVTIRSIEADLGMQAGTWTVTDSEARAKADAVNALREEEFIGSLLDDVSHLSEDQIFNQLWSDTGLCLDIDPYAIYNDPYLTDDGDDETYADGRSANCLEVVQVSPLLAVTVIGYYKYGRWNVALKLINQEAPTVETPSSDDSAVVSQAALEALRNKFK